MLLFNNNNINKIHILKQLRFIHIIIIACTITEVTLSCH